MSEHALMLMRLDSGDELIGKVKELEGAYEVVSPVGIALQPDASGNMRSVFVPFMANSREATIMIMGSHVQAIAVPSDALEANYLITIGDAPEQVDSGIVVPDKKIVIAKK